VLLLAQFAERREFRPTTVFRPSAGEPVRPRWASVGSLALIVEVKGHDARNVRFDGQTVSVRYRRGGEDSWENASEQSWEQVHALRRYLQDQGLSGIWFTGLVLFPNLREADLPPRPHNILAGDTSFEQLLNSLGEIANPWIKGNRAIISAGAPERVAALFERPLFRSLEPTPLDRQRMDRIATQRAHRTGWFEELGEKRIILTGRGGAGKTVILLQLAHRAYDENGARSLILTYNRALIADLRRTMGLMGITSSLERRGIVIDSVMAFVRRVLLHFELIKKDEDFLVDYPEHCATLAEWLRTGTVTAEDVAGVKREDATNFAFDHVFVDEGQDWPRDEIAILGVIFPPERLVVADGVDQFVRGDAADWRAGVDPALLRMRRLRRCLRMKANLATFANAFAREIGLADWSVEPTPEAGGGDIIVVEGDYFRDWSVHERLVAEARAAGNAPVDLLCCVPPSLGSGGGDQPSSQAAEIFRKRGVAVWDGAVRDIRQDFPREVEQLRIVQYDSCRGLEGWTVFALRLDDLWQYKRQQALAEGVGGDLLISPEEAADRAAARWLMIPLTRAIDTLGTEEFRLIAGAATEGMLYTDPPDPRRNIEAAPVVERFRAVGFEPEGYTLYAYAAVQVWAEAAEQAGSLELEAMIASLRQHQFDTVLGPIDFDEKG
jgi:Uncharacterized conserved protein (DUF2075)